MYTTLIHLTVYLHVYMQYTLYHIHIQQNYTIVGTLLPFHIHQQVHDIFSNYKGGRRKISQLVVKACNYVLPIEQTGVT